jgi:hypothetical protein
MTQPPHDIFNHARLRSSEMRDDAFKSHGLCLNHESRPLRFRFRTRMSCRKRAIPGKLGGKAAAL